MRILQLCHKPPLPAADGGCMAMQSITEGLLDAGHEVKILTLHTGKHPFLPDQIPDAFKSATGIEAIFADTEIKPLKLMLQLFGSGSYNLRRFDVPAFHARIAELLQTQTFDVIHLESLFTAPYISTIRNYSKAPVVLRAHNAEFQLWQRRAANCKSPLKRAVLNRIAAQLKHDERKALEAVDGIAAISEEDAATLSQLVQDRIPAAYIPFALKLPEQQGHVQQLPFTLAHIGAMDWAPTAEGARWLCDEVWPLIYAAEPEAKLLLAGRKLRENDAHWEAPGIQVLGEVDDAQRFMRQAAVVAVPPRSGGGVRIKLAEALALGCATVSTTLGAEGINCKEGEHLLIADDAHAFANAVLRLFSHPETAARLGENAKLHAAEHLNQALATKKLSDFYSLIAAAK
jgi:glycosyltransferase involved in cell wall biosynthesis